MPEECKFPKIYIIYLSRVAEIQNRETVLEGVRNLQRRTYFDFQDLRILQATDTDFRAATRKIGRIISAKFEPKNTVDESIISKVRNDLINLPNFSESNLPIEEEKIALILKKLTQKSDNYLFRNTLISSLLDNLIMEIDKIDNDPYDHDISLNSSFVRRANPIFANADQVYSISVDSYSSFWTAPELSVESSKYLDIQSNTTIRLFVFSSPYSMMKYRDVLEQHYERYGEQGRVLFTSSEVWKNYLKILDHRFASKEKNKRKNWIGLDSGGDFAILRYKSLIDATYIETILSKNQLQFRKIDQLGDLHRDIIGNLDFLEKDIFRKSIEKLGYLYRWKPEYSINDTSWFKIVSSVFHDYNMDDIRISDDEEYIDTGKIYHVVLFSNLIEKSKFTSLIRSVTPVLLDIRGRGGYELVRSIWYGGVGELPGEVIDPFHSSKLIVNNDLSVRWPHCLIVKFASQSDLEEYYSDDSHAQVRIELYRAFSEDISRLIDKMIDASNDVKILLGETLEVMVSRYMNRLDYTNYDPIEMFKSINSSIKK